MAAARDVCGGGGEQGSLASARGSRAASERAAGERGRFAVRVTEGLDRRDIAVEPNDRLNRGFTTDMKCDMAILAHMAVGALEYGAAGDFLARAALAGNGPMNI